MIKLNFQTICAFSVTIFSFNITLYLTKDPVRRISIELEQSFEPGRSGSVKLSERIRDEVSAEDDMLIVESPSVRLNDTICKSCHDGIHVCPNINSRSL